MSQNAKENFMNTNYQSLSHSKSECKYHVVFVPKYRRKALYGEIRRKLGAIFHEEGTTERNARSLKDI